MELLRKNFPNKNVILKNLKKLDRSAKIILKHYKQQ